MTAREYQQRLDRLLCLNCGGDTRPQPNGQAYCPRCRRLDSFARRKREWTLVRAFAAGVTATAAAVVAGVTVGTAAKHFRRFRRVLVRSISKDQKAAYRNLKLKPAAPAGRASVKSARILVLIEVNGQMAFVRPAAAAVAVVEQRVRAARRTAVVFEASPGGGFASLRPVPSVDPAASPPAASVRRLLRFWLSARAAVLRHRAVRWAEVDGFLAEQVGRRRLSTRDLIETLFEAVVRRKPGDESGK